MNVSQFNISLEQAIDFLKEIGLYKSLGIKAIGDYSAEIRKVSKQNKHSLIYNTAIANFDYEVLLKDDSIFQFAFGEEIRYAFIQNPQFFVSKEDFLTEIYSPDELLIFSDDEIEELIESIDELEYQQFVNEQELNANSIFLRYDSGSKGYKPLKHSYSHIHIGLNDHLRIPISKILTPLKFVLFSVRNTYFNEWKEAFIKIDDFENKILTSKNICSPIPNEFWQPIEEYGLFLK